MQDGTCGRPAACLQGETDFPTACWARLHVDTPMASLGGGGAATDVRSRASGRADSRPPISRLFSDRPHSRGLSDCQDLGLEEKGCPSRKNGTTAAPWGEADTLLPHGSDLKPSSSAGGPGALGKVAALL